MTIDRADICRRHGLAPEIADELAGETAEELEADGAARGAIALMTALTAAKPGEAALVEELHPQPDADQSAEPSETEDS